MASARSRRRSLPKLTSEIVRDDEKLAAATDDLLVNEPELRRLSRRIIRAQEILRRVLDEDGWAQYLRVEAVVNDRLHALCNTLARWAFNEGTKARRR